MKGIRDDELTARWVQFGVFSPINRLHCSNHPLLGKEPWNYNEQAQKAIKKFLGKPVLTMTEVAPPIVGLIQAASLACKKVDLLKIAADITA